MNDAQEPVRSINRESIESWLIDKLAETLLIQPEQIDLTKSVFSYDLDSSLALGVTGDLKDWLDVDLTPTLFWEYPKPVDLIDFLLEVLSNKGE